jgi:hypothetical protein
MEIKKLLFRRELKLVTLLLTSLLIASASAAVYYSLSMTSTISVATTSVYFVEGADATSAGVSLSGDNRSAWLTQLKAYPNVTTTYSDPVKIRNNHTSTAFNIRLRHVSLSGAATNFVFVNFTLVGSSSLALNYTSDQSSWTLPSPSTTSWLSIPASTEWSISVETKAIANAAADSVSIEIAFDVE